MRPRELGTIVVVSCALAACRKSPVPAPDAGAPERVAAPNSSLGRELGVNDAGRGEYRMYDDGPWCGFAPRVDREKPLGPGNYGPSTSWLGFFETKTAPQDGPRVYDRAAIALALKGPQRAFTGQPISMTLSLMNGSAQPLQYGMPVDGSFEHWRAPFVDLYAREQGSGRTYRWTFGKDFGRCGNVDSRKAGDYVVIPPGTRKLDPFGPRSRAALAPVVTTAGRYALWVVYASSCMGADIKGAGSEYDAPRPADLFEGTIASNGITLDVTAEP